MKKEMKRLKIFGSGIAVSRTNLASSEYALCLIENEGAEQFCTLISYCTA
jgi:hypothetical protein